MVSYDEDVLWGIRDGLNATPILSAADALLTTIMNDETGSWERTGCASQRLSSCAGWCDCHKFAFVLLLFCFFEYLNSVWFDRGSDSCLLRQVSSC